MDLQKLIKKWGVKASNYLKLAEEAEENLEYDICDLYITKWQVLKECTRELKQWESENKK